MLAGTAMVWTLEAASWCSGRPRRKEGKEYGEQRAAEAQPLVQGISRPHQLPTSPSLALPPEGACASQNSATCWRLTIQTHKPVGDILRYKPLHFF